MPVTQLVLVVLMALATLCSAGLLVEWQDDGTAVLLGLAGSILWLFVAIQSFEVIVGLADDGTPTTAAMDPLWVLALAFGALTAVLVLLQLLSAVSDRSDATEADVIGGR